MNKKISSKILATTLLFTMLFANILSFGEVFATSTGTYDLMITNRRNTNQAYSAKTVAKNINSGDSLDYDVLLIQDAGGKFYYCMEKGGALMLYSNGGATLREFYYNSTPYKNITKEQVLVLAYLNAKEVTQIGGISLNTNNNRQKLIQYYIWKSGINIGSSVTVPSTYASIIGSLQRCVNGKITIGKDILDTKTGTLTINGVVYKINSFSAYKFTSKLIYRIDNGKGYIESNYNGAGQEMFTFSSDLIKEDTPDTPKIILRKVDEEGKGLEGAIFTITEGAIGVEYSTGEDGYTMDINVEYGKKYIIQETTQPSGYTLATEYVVLDVLLNGGIIYTIYDSDNNIVTSSEYWSADEELPEELNLSLELTLMDKKEETPPDTPTPTPPTPTPPEPTPPEPTPPTPTPDTKKKAYPLLMYIKGIAFLDGIEGKDSKLDGYFNPGSGSDKGLAGIKVEVYDEATNELAILATRESLTLSETNVEYDTSKVDFEALDKYGKAITYTDEDGKFEFYGLNPSHTYYLVFTYNGMRYAEIKAVTETGMNISAYDTKLENASKAIEVDRQTKIVDIFSEIGTYPYNYNSLSKGGYNIAYNQDDVEEAIKNGLSKCGNSYETLYNNLSSYMDESMAYFIQDCQVTAKISGLGNILKEAENKVREYNVSIKKNANYVYPVVEYHNSPNIDQVEFEKIYGYNIYKWYSDPVYEIQNGNTVFTGYTAPYWHNVGNDNVGTLKYDERIDGEWETVKDSYIQRDKQLMDALNAILAKSNGDTKYEANIQGHWTELKEGYWHITQSDVEWAMFDLTNQQYLGDWYNACTSVTYEDSYNKLYENLKKLNDDINRNLPCANLGVQYRSTFDMALYNDVLKADVTINGVPGTYKYDKRAANGKAFSFGVNESDLRDYYYNLTNGNVETLKNLKYNTTITSTEEYMNYFRESDIHYLTTPMVTHDGISSAGGYSDQNNSIYLTYKVRIINQSEVKGTITEIVDHYSNDFEVTKVYDESNNDLQYSTTSIYAERGTKTETVSGYNVIYIKLDKELSNNESQYIYIVLKMKDIKATLTPEVLNSEAGYKTVNLAEINGYKTANGYIDIDSMPGNIAADGKDRFENGKYEDDESKSPTLIFKNPNKEGRTISGVVFEDSTTGEWVTTQTRQSTANNQLDDTDIRIQGATVQLIEISDNGATVVRSQTDTATDGSYKFICVRPGNYIIRFGYGNTDMTALTTKNIIDDEGNTISVPNAKSYNGESYENTESKTNTTLGAEGYWYTDSDIESSVRYSDAIDDSTRRRNVTDYFSTLKNGNAELLNSYKDSKVNRRLVNDFEKLSYMFADTNKMKLEMEYVGSKNENTNGTTTTSNEDGKYTFIYDITNVDFGIVERSRAKLDINKQVSYISLVDSTGKEITGGTYEQWKNGKVKHVKWVPSLEKPGFVDMEIDTELLSGATLKITYSITVTDNSEKGNMITDIEVIDYVTNNLNYSAEYKDFSGKSNSANNWETVTTKYLEDNGYVNSKSINSTDDTNKIYLETYQTILKATFKPGETKTLTLEKNLSSDEDSNFNYSNIVEIVSSKNTTGRGDYASIYGNLDPITYTSRQGDLYWDYISGKTCSADNETDGITENSGFNAIRIAEGDSASAEEVQVTPPTGFNLIEIPGECYIFGLTLALSIVALVILVKKYKELEIEQE